MMTKPAVCYVAVTVDESSPSPLTVTGTNTPGKLLVYNNVDCNNNADSKR